MLPQSCYQMLEGARRLERVPKDTEGSLLIEQNTTPLTNCTSPIKSKGSEGKVRGS